jgi:hypothetical protein
LAIGCLEEGVFGRLRFSAFVGGDRNADLAAPVSGGRDRRKMSERCHLQGGGGAFMFADS